MYSNLPHSQSVMMLKAACHITDVRGYVTCRHVLTQLIIIDLVIGQTWSQMG